MNKKQKTSVSISDECKRLLRLLSAKNGISQSAIIEIAVREKAQREQVQ